MPAKAIMVQGTGSHVGKSIIVAALCRIFRQDGHRVAPFKSQNMALNSFVTRDGKEMGRSQVVQARAAGIEPHVDMNPVLLKPVSGSFSQVIVNGVVASNMNFREYQRYEGKALRHIRQAYRRLSARYDIIVIEGAGSPAEINLKGYGIANMRIAELARAPVILVGDIEFGGVFAWLVGTVELLEDREQDRVKGFIINKFRGSKRVLNPGLTFLKQRTGKPVLGVLPYMHGMKIEEEDAVPLARRKPWRIRRDRVNIEVLHLPHVSNFTDFDILEMEQDVNLRYVGQGEPLTEPDILIIPGSKNTIGDLSYLKESGYADDIVRLAQNGATVVGICGGFQMLGREIADPYGMEARRGNIRALSLLNVSTTLARRKVTSQVEAVVLVRGFRSGGRLKGYEIHLGKTTRSKDARALFNITRRSGRQVDVKDGAISDDGKIWGTYMHGLFDNDTFRSTFLNRVRRGKGLAPVPRGERLKSARAKEREFDKLAGVVRKSLDMRRVYEILDQGLQ